MVSVFLFFLFLLVGKYSASWEEVVWGFSLLFWPGPPPSKCYLPSCFAILLTGRIPYVIGFFLLTSEFFFQQRTLKGQESGKSVNSSTDYSSP